MEFLTDPVVWWIEPFTANPFMRTALWAGLLAALTTTLVGTWVVLKGMSFLGDAVAHGVLPGIAIAFVLGYSTTAGAFIAAIVMMFTVTFIRSNSPFSEDTSIGIVFAGFLALAVVIMSSSSGAYSGDLTRFLFGSVTGVDDSDLRRQAVVALITLGAVVGFYRALLVATFDESKAQLLGLRPRLTHLALLVLIAIAIVASFEAVGSLLVFAFLVAPPATAALLVRQVPLIMTTGVVIGAFSVVLGLLISFHYDTAASATMALVAVAAFIVVLVARSALTAAAQLRSRVST